MLVNSHQIQAEIVTLAKRPLHKTGPIVAVNDGQISIGCVSDIGPQQRGRLGKGNECMPSIRVIGNAIIRGTVDPSALRRDVSSMLIGKPSGSNICFVAQRPSAWTAVKVRIPETVKFDSVTNKGRLRRIRMGYRISIQRQIFKVNNYFSLQLTEKTS